jgi:hypothetical protein
MSQKHTHKAGSPTDTKVPPVQPLLGLLTAALFSLRCRLQSSMPDLNRCWDSIMQISSHILCSWPGQSVSRLLNLSAQLVHSQWALSLASALTWRVCVQPEGTSVLDRLFPCLSLCTQSVGTVNGVSTHIESLCAARGDVGAGQSVSMIVCTISWQSIGTVPCVSTHMDMLCAARGDVGAGAHLQELPERPGRPHAPLPAPGPRCLAGRDPHPLRAAGRL